MIKASGPIILVVDEDPACRDCICQILGHYGFRHFSAGSADEALAKFKTGEPVAALITNFPVLLSTGGEIADALKTLRADLPIVLNSADISETTLLEFLRYERFVAIRKPFQPPLLVQALKHVLSLPAGYDGSERKKWFRLETRAQGELGGKPVALRDLSLGGVCIEANEDLRVGSEVEIGIPFLGPLKLQARVIWSNSPVEAGKAPQFGLEFSGLSPGDLKVIRAFLIKEIRRTKAGWFKPEILKKAA